MSQKITFTSVVLESFSRKHDIGVAQFVSSWNANVAKALGWSDLPESVSGADLDGDLAASSLELKPMDAEAVKHKITIDIVRVHKFEAVRLELKGKKGKGHRVELRFKVSFVKAGVCEMLEAYMLTIGAGKSTGTVSYVKQAELVFENQIPTDEMREAVAAAND